MLTKAMIGSNDDHCIDVFQETVAKVHGVISAEKFRFVHNDESARRYRWGYMVVYDKDAADIGRIIEFAMTSSSYKTVIGSAIHDPDYITYFEPVIETNRKELTHGYMAKEGRAPEEKETDLARTNAERNSEPYLTRWRRADVDSLRLEDWAGAVAGPTYLEATLRIPRSTLHRWQRRNQVIALRKGLGRHVFPLAQFVDGRPVAGIPDVFALAKHPRVAWSWLVHPSPYIDGNVPIELLRRDMVTEVVVAAKMSF
ncbi:hypothetical protein FJ938_29155 [Mesorhizobium sp. B2-4-14]|uniref:antitoxin Xre/MbcA/ParS-like domain-containing protein n=1 Tax=Mesorhizobium sp. B2-4-14 TaxID=2589935 RepID=UPI00112E47A5|nr:hypothetical protein [Mesorhizobium sp. B2-4-14]TPK93519.1 hypothetical protein FJ938_29155 [Mesorhizobium sp. B2-4-14]